MESHDQLPPFPDLSDLPAEAVAGGFTLGQSPEGFRSGFVALVGRPNVGKSTLMNQLVGEKVAITSPVAQTTRNRLRAILTTPTAQLVLVDTPGIHKPHHLLGERLVQTARGAIGEVDQVLLLVDGSQAAGRGDGFIVELLERTKVPVQVALNKCDLVDPSQAAELEASYRELVPGWPLHPVSALNGDGTEALVNALAAELPEGPHLYPPDAVSDQPEQLLLGPERLDGPMWRQRLAWAGEREVGIALPHMASFRRPPGVQMVLIKLIQPPLKGGRCALNSVIAHPHQQTSGLQHPRHLSVEPGYIQPLDGCGHNCSIHAAVIEVTGFRFSDSVTDPRMRNGSANLFRIHVARLDAGKQARQAQGGLAVAATHIPAEVMVGSLGGDPFEECVRIGGATGPVVRGNGIEMAVIQAAAHR